MASGLRTLYPGVSPAAVLNELGASQGADRSHPRRQEQAHRLEQWLCAKGLGIPKSALEIGFVGAGAEHESYFDPIGHVAVKLTHDGRFGHCLSSEGGIATPFEYLQRLAWHNELFGDDLELNGVLLDSAGIRLVTTQSWINSHPGKLSPTQPEIDAFLAEFGYLRSPSYPDGYIYFNPESGLVIGDAQPANLLFDLTGVVRPIDLVIAQPDADFRKLLEGSFVV